MSKVRSLNFQSNQTCDDKMTGHTKGDNSESTRRRLRGVFCVFFANWHSEIRVHHRGSSERPRVLDRMQKQSILPLKCRSVSTNQCCSFNGKWLPAIPEEPFHPIRAFPLIANGCPLWRPLIYRHPSAKRHSE